MKKTLMFLAIAAGVAIIACNKQTILPTVTTTTIFSVTSKMTHAKDTISSKGDTITLYAQGTINDTSRTNAISGSFKAVDTVTRITLGAMYVKSLTLSFDTSGMASTGRYHWTTTVAFPIPAVTAKTKILTTAQFGYGINTSASFGNTVGTDSKSTYAK